MKALRSLLHFKRRVTPSLSAQNPAHTRAQRFAMAPIPTFKEVTPVAAMKTVVNLYMTGFLQPAPEDKLQAKPDTALNDKVVIIQGDITQIACDAIVNAANESLLGGGGVDGAIHRAAGRGLFRECVTLDGCQTGAAKITGGYRLPAKHVIHTVGPIYFRDGEDAPALLESCYSESLRVAIANGVRSVVFCCIGTGIYGYPNDEAAHIACKTVRRLLEQNVDKLDKVVFCLFLPKDVKAYKTAAPYYFPNATKGPNEDQEASVAETKGQKEVTAAAETGLSEVSAAEEVIGVGKPAPGETEAKEEEDSNNKTATPTSNANATTEVSDTVPGTEAGKKDKPE